MDTDGSDSGGDLLDFVVSDDYPVSSIQPTSSTLATSPTVESVDSLPDLDGVLMSSKGKKILGVVDTGDDGSDVDATPRAQGGGRLQRRRPVFDSDSDE
ncbi:type III restriction enzyme [Colletotrichum salicis]|uniref:Type III restriction enzyme n=1 Tax=Colletotrichum salicis TaxID=1209931 RepID=A0A135SB35_9PEZI|nr:type III restriction enzyme [Colletotrichum salicis]